LFGKCSTCNATLFSSTIFTPLLDKCSTCYVSWFMKTIGWFYDCWFMKTVGCNTLTSFFFSLSLSLLCLSSLTLPLFLSSLPSQN
jgi:hypothetical protein